MSWFPCYVNDLLGSMRWKMMVPAQRGAYWQLICWQMQSDDGLLPLDVGQLSTLADLDLNAECNAIILDAFPEQGNGRANQRAFREWGKRNCIRQVRSKAGAKGGAKRVANLKQEVKQEPSKCLDSDSSKIEASAATYHISHITPTSTSLNPSGSAPSGAGALAPERKKAEGIGFDGEGWMGISDRDREAWTKAYPACDIDRQVAAAAEWAKANPRKAKRNWRRFIVNWLSRKQERGGDVASTRPLTPDGKIAYPDYETRQQAMERRARAKIAAEQLEREKANAMG